jgi:hypothetical protein
MEEVTYSWIIAVTVYSFPSEVLFIMAKFSFNIRKLGIELISLGSLSQMHSCIG